MPLAHQPTHHAWRLYGFEIKKKTRFVDTKRMHFFTRQISMPVAASSLIKLHKSDVHAICNNCFIPPKSVPPGPMRKIATSPRQTPAPMGQHSEGQHKVTPPANLTVSLRKASGAIRQDLIYIMIYHYHDIS